jgi:hypothetical protein
MSELQSAHTRTHKRS